MFQVVVTIFGVLKRKLFLGELFFKTQGMCDKIFSTK
jgi:hypothetical protein